MVEARNNGVPLLTQAPRVKLTKSIVQLAHTLDQLSLTDDRSDDAKRPQKKGFFSFLSANSR